MRKRSKKPKNSINPLDSKVEKMTDSFSILMDSYTVALEDNSLIISAMLEELSKRELSEEERKAIKSIGKDIEKIDKGINKLGK